MGYRHFSAQWGGEHADDMDDYAGFVSLRRVRLDSGGYANRGRDYFGHGAPVWHVHNLDEPGVAGVRDNIDFYLRAADRTAAKREIRRGYPKAKFRR